MSEVGRQNESNRRGWIETVLKQIPAGNRILDAGAGEQQFKRFCNHLRYVAQDFARYDGKGDGRGLQTAGWDQKGLDIVCDITAIPEPDGCFDVILCTEVFEHLPNPLLALKEFARLLRPGGQLIITAPFASFTHFAPFHFATGFNRYYYQTHLPAHGFEIVELRSNGNFFEFVAQEIRRIRTAARRYTRSGPRPWEALALKVVLGMLNRFSGQDSGSDELAVFGYHVRASRKQIAPAERANGNA